VTRWTCRGTPALPGMSLSDLVTAQGMSRSHRDRVDPGLRYGGHPSRGWGPSGAPHRPLGGEDETQGPVAVHARLPHMRRTEPPGAVRVFDPRSERRATPRGAA
jgi:hypothetical protein